MIGFGGIKISRLAGLMPPSFRFRLSAVLPEFEFGQAPIVAAATKLYRTGETLGTLIAPTPQRHFAHAVSCLYLRCREEALVRSGGGH